jgi:hypothetical protein
MMIGMLYSIAKSLLLYTIQHDLPTNPVILPYLPSLTTQTSFSTALSSSPCGYSLHPVGPSA